MKNHILKDLESTEDSLLSSSNTIVKKCLAIMSTAILVCCKKKIEKGLKYVNKDEPLLDKEKDLKNFPKMKRNVQ